MYGRYWARTSDPQLVDRELRSRLLAVFCNQNPRTLAAHWADRVRSCDGDLIAALAPIVAGSPLRPVRNESAHAAARTATGSLIGAPPSVSHVSAASASFCNRSSSSRSDAPAETRPLGVGQRRSKGPCLRESSIIARPGGGCGSETGRSLRCPAASRARLRRE